MHGGWGPWSDWSECTAKCDGGTQSRSRNCNYRDGDVDCDGAVTETGACGIQPCVTKYTITHKTGTGTGATSNGYFFTIIGSEGETSAHDCIADRSEGAVGECLLSDD